MTSERPIDFDEIAWYIELQREGKLPSHFKTPRIRRALAVAKTIGVMNGQFPIHGGSEYLDADDRDEDGLPKIKSCT